jgi:ribose/xylose/arabinose/galactoside ABC-type transport system permease subunit
MNVNGLIATLTTWWICVGFSLGMTKALSPYGFPEAFQLIGQTRILGFRSIVIYAAIIFITLTLLLHFHRIGMYIYSSGGSKENSSRIGIDIENLGMKLYILVGLLAGLVGLLISSRLNAASPLAVDGMALRVIAAVVIGGGNLSGGEGTTIGGLLGLITMNILNNAIIQYGWSPYWQKAILGGILLAAVTAEKIKFDLNIRRINNV